MFNSFEQLQDWSLFHGGYFLHAHEFFMNVSFRRSKAILTLKTIILFFVLFLFCFVFFT